MVQVQVLSCLIMMERNTGSDLVRVICTYQDRLENSVSLNFHICCLHSAGIFKLTKLEYKISFEIKIFNRFFPFLIFYQNKIQLSQHMMCCLKYLLSRLMMELYCILHIVVLLIKLIKLCFCVSVCIDEALGVITRNSLLN
jgi:hypothetical protein